MEKGGSESTNSLRCSWIRESLFAFLGDLTALHPEEIWRAARQSGSIAGIDEVYHFFFDDHDFDVSDIGAIFYDIDEVQGVAALKAALDALLAELPHGSDGQYVEHPMWAQVRRAAVSSLAQLERRGL